MRLIDGDELIKDFEDWHDGVQNDPYIDRDYKRQILTDILEAIDYVNEQEDMNKPMKWRKQSGLFTPGADPCYICPNCQDRDSEHINGIECHQHWNYCPVCGIRLKY